MVKVTDVMIPIENYVSVSPDVTIPEMFQILEKDRQSKPELKHAHRDVLVISPEDGSLLGKVTMTDIIQALEPGYKKLQTQTEPTTLNRDYVSRIFKDFNLWPEPLADLCRRVSDVRISEIMHAPAKTEFLDADDSIEKALHLFIIGIHQPLFVRKDDKTIGVVRFGDIFEIIRKHMLACAL